MIWGDDFMKKILSLLQGKAQLRSKITLAFVVFSSVPLLTLGATSLYLIDLSHRRDVANLESQLIDQKAEEVEKFLSDTLGVLELHVAVDTSFISAESQEPLLKGLLAANAFFEEVSLIDNEGFEMRKVLRENFPPHYFDFSRLPLFQQALRGNSSVGALEGTMTGPTVRMASPVRNSKKEIVGVLMAVVNVSSLVRSIENARLGTAGSLALFDAGGALVATKARGTVLPGSMMTDVSRIRALVNGAEFDGLGEGDRYESMFDKTPVVGAGRKLSGTGWLLLVEWPLADADAIVDEVRRQVLTFTIFSIFAVFALAPLFASRLTRPIRALAKGAGEIEQGHFDEEVKIETHDELEDLGGAFNRMAQGLKRLNELQKEFVFIAAHELRTPVTAIKGFLSLIFEGSAGAVSEPIKKYLTTVQQANDRLVQLVNDLLEIARSEAGRLKIETAPFDIREGARAILAEIKPLADQKKISISYMEPTAPLMVLTDPDRIKEVIMNFASNAIKYGNVGGWIKIYHEEVPSGVATHVEDNGFGISEEEQKRIFEKFFRSETREVRTITGTGLGLFITKELVEKMGGKIWFTSEKGKGSRFSFILSPAPSPVAKSPQA